MSRRRTVRAFAASAFVGVLLFASAAPANVQEQRARLPPPAENCQDPVEGVWMSHAYYPHMAQWYIFTLTVRRTAGSPNGLEGTVHSHYWSGNDRDQEPPPCTPGMFHRTVIMPARGSVVNQRIEFNGLSWQHESSFCGGVTSGYNPDRFSGTIDPSILEFQSVNNDGGAMINVPTVFRRVRCLDATTPPPPTRVDLRPPPFQPPGGCGCSR